MVFLRHFNFNSISIVLILMTLNVECCVKLLRFFFLSFLFDPLFEWKLWSETNLNGKEKEIKHKKFTCFFVLFYFILFIYLCRTLSFGTYIHLDLYIHNTSENLNLYRLKYIGKWLKHKLDLRYVLHAREYDDVYGKQRE